MRRIQTAREQYELRRWWTAAEVADIAGVAAGNSEACDPMSENCSSMTSGEMTGPDVGAPNHTKPSQGSNAEGFYDYTSDNTSGYGPSGGGGGWSGTPDSTGGASSGSSSSSPARSPGGVGDDNVMDISRPLYDKMLQTHPDADMISGYRPGGDGYDEHNNGATDWAVTPGDQATAQSYIDTGLANGADFVMWENNLYYPGGRVVPDQTPESGTAGHFDHVHFGVD